MAVATSYAVQRLTIIAQDPAVCVDGKIPRAEVAIPAERLAPGPWGYRVQVIDYDATSSRIVRPREYRSAADGFYMDPYAGASDSVLLSDPGFHGQNAYAIVMRILARFEYALGRRISWSFGAHQIKVAPHAFADANAFYSARDEGLFFGYFAGSSGTVFSCLSHDVVAHETTHALLDGLRSLYTEPSSPDQAAFHEGFADVVALLSVFALREVVEAAIDLSGVAQAGDGRQRGSARSMIAVDQVTPERLKETALFSIAKQMGAEMSSVRGAPLRQSVKLTPSTRYLDQPEYLEPHRRGEILVAAVMNAFLDVWSARLSSLGQVAPGFLDRHRVVEEGADVADHLLTIMIRAIDYCPPAHLSFGDFLSALLTADCVLYKHDSKYAFRNRLRKAFADFGIQPSSKPENSEPGMWETAPETTHLDRSHFESLRRDPDEMFHFLWENRKPLGLVEGVFTQVQSVRPCLRIAPDGFYLNETVAEYVQRVELEPHELKRRKIDVPSGVSPDTKIQLHGGGTLIFDEFGRLKYHIRNRLDAPRRQTERLRYLWEYGFLEPGAASQRRFASLHRRRATDPATVNHERWC
jgi:hypothetical protein